MKYNGLDVYDIVLDNLDIGIKATSLVSVPAIESNFLHFGKNKTQFSFADEEKRELVGAIMIPDKLIYRKVGEQSFYVNFTKEVIKELTSKMIKSGTAGMFTVQHKHDLEKDEVDIQEIWVKESDTDKSMEFGIDEPVGTAFMKVKVNNDVLWNEVKEHGLNGFSIELDASIVEKNELLFNKNPKKEMKITDVFSNTINVNGVNLYFNSDLKKNAYLVFEGEGGSVTPYAGEFNHENVIYKVEEGIVLEAEDVQLSTGAAIQELKSEFGEVKDSIASILAKEKAIEEKEAELDLLKTQFAQEKEDYKTAQSDADSKVELRLSAQIVSNGDVGKNWLAQF